MLARPFVVIAFALLAASPVSLQAPEKNTGVVKPPSNPEGGETGAPRRKETTNPGSGGPRIGSPSVGRVVRERFPEPAGGRGLSWERWWFHNKDRYLDVHRRFVLTAWMTGPGGVVDAAAGKSGLELKIKAFLTERREKLLPFFLQAAASKDRQLRVSALFALGHLGDSQAVDPIVKLVGDSDGTVRQMAVLALGMIGDDLAQPTLEALLNGGADGRRAVGRSRISHRLRGLAALSLGLLRGHQHSRELLSLAVRRRKLPDEIRMGAITALGLIGHEKVVAELAAVGLSGKENPALRSLAVTALGRTGHTNALEPIARALRSKHRDVQAAAVVAVAEFPYDTPDGERLRAAVREFQRIKATLAAKDVRERGLNLNREAARVDKLEAPRLKMRRRFAQVLRQRIEKYHGARDRGLAALALGAVGQARDAARLERLLGKGAAEVKGFAALGLGRLARRVGDEDGRIARLLAQRFLAMKSRPRQRGALALALGMTGHRSAGTFLLEAAVKTKDPAARAHLVQSLGMLRHRPGYDLAREAVVGARDPRILQNTVQGFALLADPVSGVKLIQPFVRTTHQPERMALASALAFSAIGVRETLEPLLAYLRSSRNPVLSRAFVTEAVGIAANLERLPTLSRLAHGHNFSVATPPVDLAVRLRW